MKIKPKFITQLCLFIALPFTFCKNNTAEKQPQSLQIAAETNNSTFNYLPSAGKNQIITHEFYTLSYVEQFEQAEWVAYELMPNNSVNTHFQRPFFTEDELVKTKSADWRNYKNSGFDKGHLCPAGDMSFSEKAYNDTFLTSNIAPQTHAFNSGIWNTLEQKVRYWAQKYNGIYVVTGPVLSPNLKTIGKEKVAVPDFFYKVLLKKSSTETKMIAFLLPSNDSQKPLYQFVVTVDEVERLTGINFFSALPDHIENNLESNSSYKMWSF